MTFDELLQQVRGLLEVQGRVTYASLKRRFDLDDDYLADLKSELIDALRVAIDEDNKVLVWCTEHASPKHVPLPSSYTPSHLAERIRAEQAHLETRGTNGERKTITILFADLKGSTAMLEGLDPEVARAVIDPALQIMMDAVHRYEGYVAQALGDGILALFGAPLAHEDHAQRAVYAALKMQEDLKPYALQLRLKQGASLALRVGLNTGEVVVRSIRKDDLHTDYVPVGHSINLAARMEQIATPGAIFITEHTAKLAEGYFQLKSLGSAEIKGVEQPVPVYEVTGVGQLRTRLQVAASRGLTRFIGRQSEIEQMQTALAQARAGRGQVIGIMGEPGMGKSRLVHEFKAKANGFAVFEAYSASHGKASPYLPITELLKGYFQIQLGDDERARREKVIGKLLGLDRGLEDVLPYYFALLNIQDPEFPLPPMDAQLRRRRTFDAMKKVITRASMLQPLILIFEDLHWVDSETQGFLDSLVESLASARILLLTNYRPEYRQEWGSKSYCTQLRLAPFGDAEAQEFLDVLLGEQAASTSKLLGVRQWIMGKTAGTPFFMEEVVQELFEQGTLQRDLNGGVSISNNALSQVQIPPTVQGVLAARIDRLAAAEKSLLQKLAVIGREFPFGLATAVVSLPEEELHQLLGALQKKEFLYEQPSFPEVEYIFKHALTQEVAYNSLLQETRKKIHEQTANVIESRYAAELEDHYADLAHHYRRSDNVAKALQYLALAGEHATRQAAHTDAMNYLDAALALFAQMPRTEASDALELKLLMAALVPMHTIRGMSHPDIERVCLRAQTLSETLGESHSLMRVLLELRVYHTMLGNCQQALTFSHATVKLANELDSARYRLQAYSAQSIAENELGLLQESRRSVIMARANYDAGDHAWHHEFVAYDPTVLALAFDSYNSTVLGYPDQALRIAEDALNLSRPFNPYVQGMGFIGVAFVGLFRLDARAAEEAALSLIAIGEEYDYPDWIGFGNGMLACAHCESHPSEGSKALTHWIDALESAGVKIALGFFLGVCANNELANGDRGGATQTLKRAFDLLCETEEYLFAAELHRLQGDLIAQFPSGPQARDDAETHYLKAIEIAQSQHAKWWELRATVSLARLLHTHGRREEAYARLHPVYTWFTEGLDLPDLQRAKALLDELAA